MKEPAKSDVCPNCGAEPFGTQGTYRCGSCYGPPKVKATVVMITDRCRASRAEGIKTFS